MDPERWEAIKRLYNSVLGCEPDKQEGFLRDACGGDDSLRKEVETLLAQQRKADGFMKSPAMEVAAHVMVKDQGGADIESLAGQSVAHYRIVEKIGEGGMGVVYRAQDTRLDRYVAIKSLPDIFAADPSRMARFEREAKILATLNHPNIASVYGLEESDRKRFLVLELVEGKTLADRLKKGRIPLDETLEICCQIAVGLEAAHEKGIIHRDLKPSNIKLTPEGKVKILDFGLAKALDHQGHGPTDSSTEIGVILGTAAYMSPEQAQGKQLDKRTDIWAFGCILFECLAGKRTFPGNTISETLAAVINAEPTWEMLPHSTPEKVREVLKRCLNKDPDRRMHDIADARIEMEESRSQALAAESRSVPRRRRIIAACGIAAVAIILIGTGWFFVNRSHSTKEAPLTVTPLITYPGALGSPTFSPDGNDIAFSWNGEKRDNTDIYRAMIGLGRPHRLTFHSAPDLGPAWSPDGRLIAFCRFLGENKRGIFVVPALGGTEQKVTDFFAPSMILAWSPDSRWLVISDRNGPAQPNPFQSYGLHLLLVATGEKRNLTSPPRARFGDRNASFSPDGRSLAFARILDFNRSEIYRLSLSDEMLPIGEPERLVYEDKLIYGVLWTPDGKDILYSSGNYLSSESFLRRIKIAEGKRGAAYQTSRESFGEGARTFAISANGHRLAYSRYSQEIHIYRFELPGKSSTVKDPERYITSKRSEYAPDYSPDGRFIAFASTRSGNEEIWICNADGSNPWQLTSMNGPQTCNPRWSPDSQTIVFDSRKSGSCDVYSVSANGGSPKQLTSDPNYDGTPSWSRDGKWIFFLSNRTGRQEIFKMPAEGGEAIQVTRNGGYFALESPDGKKIFYSKIIEGHSSLWQVGAADGVERQIHLGPMSYGSDFIVLEDGIYLTKTDGSLDFVNFASGKSTTIARFKGRFAMGLTISPDHRWILCNRWEPISSDIMLVENFR